MKIIHLVSHHKGGAGKAAIRLNDALNINNIDSRLLTINYSDEKKRITSIVYNTRTKLEYKVLNKINRVFLKYGKPTEYFSCEFFGYPILKNKRIRDADIIHLHWVNDGMISYRAIKKLAVLRKKVVWTMHDINTFTGGCHYSGNCDKYKDNCKDCPYARGRLSNKIWKKKKDAIANLDVTVVGCSKWITDCAKESSIFKDKRCINIPNCVDMNKFKPIDRTEARIKLGIKENKKIILFGAMSSTSDRRKGFEQLKKALSKLPREEYQCYVFGTDEMEDFNVDVKTLGFIKDEQMLMLAYNSADVFVAPSLQENLANTVVESISCGTPVVAFNIGGMPDMIHNGKTGYIAKYLNEDDLAKGIIECSKHSEELRNSCRKFAVGNYSYESISKKFNEIYKEILNGGVYDKKN